MAKEEPKAGEDLRPREASRPALTAKAVERTNNEAILKEENDVGMSATRGDLTINERIYDLMAGGKSEEWERGTALNALGYGYWRCIDEYWKPVNDDVSG
jgi:hypothetical protein